MAAWKYLFAGTRTIDKHSFNFMFWYMVKKYQSYQNSRQGQYLEPTGAIGYSALRLGTFQTTESEDETSTGDACNDSIKLQIMTRVIANLTTEGIGYSAFEHNKELHFPSIAGLTLFPMKNFYESIL